MKVKGALSLKDALKVQVRLFGVGAVVMLGSVLQVGRRGELVGKV